MFSGGLREAVENAGHVLDALPDREKGHAMSTMPGCDYDVSRDYAVCRACGTRQPRIALVGDWPVCADVAWCVATQKAVKAAGATKPSGGYRGRGKPRKKRDGRFPASRRGRG